MWSHQKKMKLIKANCHRSGKVLEFTIDESDLSFVTQWSWHINCNGYVYRQFRDETGKCRCIFLHRELANTPDGFFTDHINRNKLDNRRSNLRIATKSQNAMNSASRKSSSGKTGIRIKDNGKFTARITINRKELHLGVFNTFHEASLARDAASKLYFGEFSPR